MPYRRNNYSYVIDAAFNPFQSMGEMLAPFQMYKQEYEKAEAAYDDLTQKADVFKNMAALSDDNPKAKAIYEGYANELTAQAQDLANNGLTMGNRRALTNLKRRYQGEIGMLDEANKQLQEIQKQRNALAAAGKQVLYGNDNPRLDDFLDGGNRFNRYAIDSVDLENRGAALGKVMSSREYAQDEVGSILQGQYKLWRQTHGIRDIDQFMNSNLVKNVVDKELMATGAASNLSGRNLDVARQNIMNGIYKGIVYEESYKPIENKDYIDALEARKMELQEKENGWVRRNGHLEYDPQSDTKLQRQLAAIQEKAGSSKSGTSNRSGSGGSGYITQNKKTVRLEWNGNTPKDRNGDADNDMKDPVILEDDVDRIGRPVPYDRLPKYMQDKVDDLIGPNGNTDAYIYYYRPYVSGGIFPDQEAGLDIEPRGITKYATDGGEEVDSDALPVAQ